MTITKKLKKSIAVIFFSAILIATATVSYAKIFGTTYDSSHDYSCCAGNQLTIFHCYTTYFLFIPIGTGYTPEPIGNETAPGQCQPQCPL